MGVFDCVDVSSGVLTLVGFATACGWGFEESSGMRIGCPGGNGPPLAFVATGTAPLIPLMYVANVSAALDCAEYNPGSNSTQKRSAVRRDSGICPFANMICGSEVRVFRAAVGAAPGCIATPLLKPAENCRNGKSICV